MQRHHYVPQFYLREWYTPGKSTFWLYCRDAAGRLLFRQKPARSVGYQNGLYTTIPEIFISHNSISNEIEEKFFSPLDSDASEIYRKLLKFGPQILSAEDRLIWSIFVNSLLERSPTRINEVKEGAERAATEKAIELKKISCMPEENKRKLWEYLDISAIANNAVLTGMVKWICNDETIRHIFDMTWIIVRLPKGKDHFLTGDSPVIVNGVSGGTPIHVLSLALSPEVLLIMHVRNEEFAEDFIHNLAILHSPLIAKQTKRYLISSRELLDNENIKYCKIANEVFLGNDTKSPTTYPAEPN